VAPNGEVDSIDAYLFDRIDGRLDRAASGAENRAARSRSALLGPLVTAIRVVGMATPPFLGLSQGLARTLLLRRP
jgi:hypothetical protein